MVNGTMRSDQILAGDRSARGGFTILELLVCVFVVPVLMSLLLPAVQSARGASRRLTCANNLKQLSLSAHIYDSDWRTFPFGSTEEPEFTSVALLMNAGEPALTDVESAIQAMGTGRTISVAVCPADSDASGPTFSYTVSMGVYWDGSRFPGNGLVLVTTDLFEHRHPIALKDVTDGQSQTVMLSERLIPRQVRAGERFISGSEKLRYAWYRAGGSPVIIDSYVEPEYVAECVGNTVDSFPQQINENLWGSYLEGHSHLLPPNVPSCSTKVLPDDAEAGSFLSNAAVGVSSLHSGGVNVALVDGSVRFIINEVDLSVWSALGTRNRGDLAAF